MKREALGVGGVRPTSRKAREVGHPRFCILQALKNERRYYSGAGEGGHPPTADLSLRDKAIKFGVRGLMRVTRPSQKTIYAVIRGCPVRPRTLATLK